MNVRQSPKSLGQSLQKIPHIPRNNLNTLKYLEIPKDKLTQNIQSNTSTRPEPQPLPDFLLLQYPAQPDIEKTLPVGHWIWHRFEQINVIRKYSLLRFPTLLRIWLVMKCLLLALLRALYYWSTPSPIHLFQKTHWSSIKTLDKQ